MKRQTCPQCNQTLKGTIRAMNVPLMSVVLNLQNRKDKYSFDFCLKCGTVYCFLVEKTDEKPAFELFGKKLKTRDIELL